MQKSALLAASRRSSVWLYRQSFGTITNTAAVRLFGTQLLTARIDLD